MKTQIKGLIFILISSFVQADDVTIYLNPSAKAPPPNVLFVLDESGSMDGNDGGPTTRMEDLKSAMATIIDDPGMKEVNAAILGYTTEYDCGRRSCWPTQLKITARADFMPIGGNETLLKNKINSLTPYAYTPTVKALEAAVKWYQSGYDSQSYESTGKSRWNEAVNISANSPLGQYDTSGNPLWCQTNSIVLLTDGEPNANKSGSGNYDYGLRDYQGIICTSDNTVYRNSRNNGICAQEIAAWAYDADLLSGTDWPGKQNITTYTIGFHTGSISGAEDFLTAIANQGGGQYYSANNAADLVDAFAEILQQAKANIPFVYTAPVIPIDINNIAVSGNEVFIPLFKPDAKQFWKGNLKKFHIAYDQNTGQISITDQNGSSVLNADGEFVVSKDYWNQSNDDDSDGDGQPNTLAGGANNHMKAGVSRKLYTYLGNPDLTASENRLIQGNNHLSPEQFGLASTSDMNDLLDWANWQNLPAGQTGNLGAPLHTAPISVEYPGDDQVYINTSDGMLHAFNARTGEENWAFMPDELLPLLNVQYRDPDGNQPIYGLDGPMTYYEINGHKYLVFGMRRGGRNYYALEVTDPNQPKFQWEIIGGQTAGFEQLGQTWSKPILVKLWQKAVTGSGSNNSYYLIFGGGYDPVQDNAGTRSDDSMGNAIYIVDPSTGALVRSITESDLDQGRMANGIAADLLPIDINADEVTDRFYAVDTGGRIIRIDVPDQKLAEFSGVDRLTASVLADINQNAGNLDTADQTQRFYNTPEVAYYDRGGQRYLALLLGSGHRPEPLSDQNQDRFYMIKDHDLWSVPSGGHYPASINESELYDATANLVQEGDAEDGLCADPNHPGTDKDCALQLLNQSKGWYIDLRAGEKVFSKAKVYDYVVLFTTYQPKNPGNIPNPCLASAADGDAYLYAINMANGGAIFENDNNIFDSTPDRDLNKSDRSVDLGLKGIMPPDPTLLFPKSEANGEIHLGGAVVALVGTKAIAKWRDRFHPINWEEVIKDQ